MNARDLGRAVLEPGFSVAGMLERAAPPDVAAALASYQASLVPLKAADPGLGDRATWGKMTQAVDVALKPTGAKLAPHFAPDQAMAWRDAVILSLSKWPPAVALAAARALVHEPFKFIGDVDAKAHELAAMIDHRHRLALFRLEQMLAEIERAADPPTPQIAPPDPAEPMTIDEIRRTPPQYIGLGLRLGYIRQEDVDQIERERQAAAGVQALAKAALRESNEGACAQQA